MSTVPEDLWALLREIAKEWREDLRERNRQLRELNTQLQCLSEELGRSTETLALPLMEKLLAERFRMNVFAHGLRVRKGVKKIGMDLLAWSDDSPATAIVVDFENRVKCKSIEHLKCTLQRFREFFPEHGNRRLHGLLAGACWEEEARAKALAERLLIVRIQDDLLKLETPASYEAREW